MESTYAIECSAVYFKNSLFHKHYWNKYINAMFLSKFRNQYNEFIDEMIIQPGKQKYDSNRCDVTEEDHVSLHNYLICV